ncbi:MAG: transcriptional regulator [Rhodobacterales bacterium]|nr:MAG: transcriptional regulator [Rhodobacterales bacterium]
MDAADRVRKVISDNKLSLKDFSEKIGVQYRTVQRYIAKERALSSDFLQAMTDHMDVSASWILSGKGDKYLGEGPNGRTSNSDFVSIQRFDIAASAGHGALSESEIGTGHYAFNRTWLARRGLNPDDLAVIAVRGDSMEPELYDQDLILLDRSQTSPRDGDMYVVRYSGDLFVKRIQVVPGNKVELRSTNRFYGPIMVTLPQGETSNALDLTFIGKVVASMHEW